MILRIALFAAAISLANYAKADVAPEITWVQEGYNFVAKLPCEGCPFLYQDTSQGSDEPWTERKDDNALLLNISLPYDSSYIALNNAWVWPATSKLPHIYANQVVQDISNETLLEIIASNQLEASHETNLGGGFFGLSYRQSLRRVKKTAAVIFQFDVTELYSDLPEKPLQHKLNDPRQKIVEMLLLQKPVMSALEPVAFEIVKAELVPRSHNPVAPTSPQQAMKFEEWDSFGRKGTPSHLLSTWGTLFVDFLNSGIWALFVFLLGVIALFVVVCLVCIFGCDFWSDDYEKAQHGKARGEKKRGRSTDLEMGRRHFKSAEELGLLGRGRVVGLGKSD